jgi:hypothetical protein
MSKRLVITVNLYHYFTMAIFPGPPLRPLPLKSIAILQFCAWISMLILKFRFRFRFWRHIKMLRFFRTKRFIFAVKSFFKSKISMFYSLIVMKNTVKNAKANILLCYCMKINTFFIWKPHQCTKRPLSKSVFVTWNNTVPE